MKFSTAAIFFALLTLSAFPSDTAPPAPAPMELLRLPALSAREPELVLEALREDIERGGRTASLEVLRLRAGDKVLWSNRSLGLEEHSTGLFFAQGAVEEGGLLWVGCRCWLLGFDPATGVIRARHRLPGNATKMEALPDGNFRVLSDCIVGENAEPCESVFREGKFTEPVFYGPNLLTRMNGLRPSMWLCPAFSDVDRSCGVTNSYLTSKAIFMQNGLPEGCKAPDIALAEVEGVYREAMAQDPTQPWHLFYLGQALWFQGKKQEAESFWSGMLEGFSHMPYYEFGWMAAYFERLGQREWADRAWRKLEALFPAQSGPGPVGASLVEVLINLPSERIGAWEARATGDWERGRLWTERRRARRPGP